MRPFPLPLILTDCKRDRTAAELAFAMLVQRHEAWSGTTQFVLLDPSLSGADLTEAVMSTGALA
jgi:hypothetical protein